MSQQSESSDLLGGYQPVEQRLICLSLYHTFRPLFSQTFPSQVSDKNSPVFICRPHCSSVHLSIAECMHDERDFPPPPPPPPPPSLCLMQHNSEFLVRVHRLASKSKWSSLLAAFRAALSKLSALLAPAAATTAATNAAATPAPHAGSSKKAPEVAPEVRGPVLA